MSPVDEHRPTVYTNGMVTCTCGWSWGDHDNWNEVDDTTKAFAEHFALEMQASKPRARRGGVDESEPTSKSHQITRGLLDDKWQTAHQVHGLQNGWPGYSEQRIRTCLAGLVRAGIAEERREGKYREYRLVQA